MRDPLGTPKFLRVGEDQPTVFSHDDAFVFQLLDQAAEMLRREGKQLCCLPILQNHLYLYRFILSGRVLGLDQLPKELFQTVSSGDASLLSNAERAGSQPVTQHRQHPSGECRICTYQLYKCFCRDKAQFAPGYRLGSGYKRQIYN